MSGETLVVFAVVGLGVSLTKYETYLDTKYEIFEKARLEMVIDGKEDCGISVGSPAPEVETRVCKLMDDYCEGKLGLISSERMHVERYLKKQRKKHYPWPMRWCAT
jgi:hypothetical protein